VRDHLHAIADTNRDGCGLGGRHGGSK
jgi:hypothetical protein